MCKKWRKYKVLWWIGKKGNRLVKKRKRLNFKGAKDIIKNKNDVNAMV